MFVLSVDVDKLRTRFLQQGQRYDHAVDPAHRSSPLVHFPGNDQLLRRVYARFVKNRDERVVASGLRRIEGCGYRHPVGADTQIVLASPFAQQQRDRVDNDRLPRAGLAGDHVESLAEIYGQRADQRVV